MQCLLLFSPQHQLIHLVRRSLGCRHPVARVYELPGPGVGHALVGGASFRENLPGQHAVAPDITERGVLPVVESLGRRPLDGDLLETVRHNVFLLLPEYNQQLRAE